MNERTVQPGEVLAEKFRVDRVLGEGGMGVVLAAFHLGLQHRVAIKLLRAALANNADVVARFLREARAAVQITSPHVARVTDVATLPDGTPYLVMEYLEGTDLSDVIKTAGPLPIADACRYILEAGEAVSEAHSLGIVHRDIKPANLFLARRRDGKSMIKVLDFGISKVSAEQSLTRTTGMMGSPLYMSPEQLRSARDVDVRTDIWALGVTLFELLAGSPPFTADDLPQLMVQIMTAEPRSLSQLRPDLPPSFVAIVERCLEKDPARRFATIDELIDALRPFASMTLAVRLGSTEVAPVGPGGTQIAGVRTTSPAAQTVQPLVVAPRARSPRTLLLLLSVIALAAAGVAVFAMTRTEPKTEPRSAGGDSTRGLQTVEAPVVSASAAPSVSAAVVPPPAPTVSVAPSTTIKVVKKLPVVPPTSSAVKATPLPVPEEGFKKGDY